MAAPTGKIFSLTLFFFFFGLLQPLRADIYVYTDRTGVRHFTNVPTHQGYRLYSQTTHHRPHPYGAEHLYDHYINEAARRYGLDPLLIKAVIKMESDFDRHARSRKGAVGLMQLMPDTAQDMHARDITDPRENIMAGARYLKKLHTMFHGDLELVLAAYNAGPTRVRTSRRIPDIRETRDYVRTVMQYYRIYKNRI